MIYTATCGGAYGLEPMVAASGPGLALATLVLLPLLWAGPIALVCAELGSVHPVEGGYYRWSRMAFGDFVGYMSGFLTWIALFATNAAYVVLFVGYLRYFLPELSATAAFAIGAALVWTAVLLNVLGIRLVGTSAVVMMVLVLLPFVAMTALGLLHWRFDPAHPFVAEGKTPLAGMADGLLVAFWLYSGYEKLSVLAEEVKEPARAFPLGLAIALPLSAASYVVPTFAALAATGDYRAWGDSYFTALAQAIGGRWLAVAMAGGALVSNAGLILVTMTGQSRLPMVLAADGLFPARFARTSPRFATPVTSLIFGGVVLTLLSLFPFSRLVGLYGPVQALAYLLIAASLFRLRRRAAPLPHGRPAPFRIPLADVPLAALLAPGTVLLVLVVLQGTVRDLWREGGFDPIQASLITFVLASGPLSYLLFRTRAPKTPVKETRP